MALDKLVDSTKLDACMTAEANAIRADNLEWELVKLAPPETETLAEDEATETDYINALSSMGVSV